MYILILRRILNLVSLPYYLCKESCSVCRFKYFIETVDVLASMKLDTFAMITITLLYIYTYYNNIYSIGLISFRFLFRVCLSYNEMFNIIVGRFSVFRVVVHIL